MNLKGKLGKIPPPVILTTETFETLCANPMDRYHGEKCGYILGRSIKFRDSTMSGNLAYLLDEPGPLISVPGFV